MAVMVYVEGKKIFNNNSGQFVLLHPRNQHKIHLNYCYYNFCHQPIIIIAIFGHPF